MRNTREMELTAAQRLALCVASGLTAGAVWSASLQARRAALLRRIPAGRHVIILGGGFAGVAAARELTRLLPREAACRITLVSETNYLLFTPLLTEVAGGQLDPGQVVSPLRRLSPRISMVQARIEGIDPRRRSVDICVDIPDAEIPAQRKTLFADDLVLALGSSSNFHGIPGLEEHSLSMKGLADASAISNRVLALLERAEVEPNSELRRGLLTIVVAGGGFSGVETMAALNAFIREAAASYPRVDAGEIRTVLIHMEDRLLPEFNKELASDAQRELERRGVEVWLNTTLAAAGDGFAETDQRGRLATHTLVWTGGVQANPLAGKLDTKHGHNGSIVVDRCCAVPGYPGLWAVGDCAQVPQADDGGTYAPLAQNAVREGECAARNIVARIRGGAPQPISYRTIGQLALVGRRAGVASVWGIRFSGLIAWAMWRAVYLVKMPSPRRRARIALNWALDAIFGYDVVERQGSSRSRYLPNTGGTAS